MRFKFYLSTLIKIIFIFCIFIQPLNIYSQNVNLILQPDSAHGKDALIADCIPCGYTYSNYGDFVEFNALSWTINSNNAIHRSLIQFDFSSIPTNSIVQNATLTLYFDPNSSNAFGLHSNLSGPNDAYLQKINSPWDEHLVTWNNQPPTTTNNQVYLEASTTGTENYTIDITQMVQDFVNHPEQNNGMMLKLVSESNYRCLLFESSDNQNISLHPKVEINYSKIDTGCLNLQYHAEKGIDALIADCIPCGYFNSNYGDFPEFNALAWTNGGNSSDHRSLIFWDLSKIPAHATIQNAFLNLYFSNSNINANGSHSSLSGPNDAYLQRILNPWDEHTVTWENQPLTTTMDEVYLPMSSNPTQDYMNLDVTKFISDMVKDPAKNYGLMLKLNTESAYRCLLFASSDNPDSSKHPKLSICYSISDSIIANDNLFYIYPNPSPGKFTVSFNNLEYNSILKIYNSIGQELFNEALDKSILRKNLNLELSQGLYFVKLIYSEKEFAQKLIIY